MPRRAAGALAARLAVAWLMGAILARAYILAALSSSAWICGCAFLAASAAVTPPPLTTGSYSVVQICLKSLRNGG